MYQVEGDSSVTFLFKTTSNGKRGVKKLKILEVFKILGISQPFQIFKTSNIKKLLKWQQTIFKYLLNTPINRKRIVEDIKAFKIFKTHNSPLLRLFGSGSKLLIPSKI